MIYFFLISLGVVAFLSALIWRRKITRRHNEFRTKVEQATDEEQAKRLYQAHLKKQL